jgi:zinc protease
VLGAEITRLTTAPITNDELKIARNQLLASKLQQRETFEGKAETLAEAAAIYGDVNRANTDLADLQAVTPAQVQEAAKKWFTDKNQLVIEYLPEGMKTKGKGKK